MFGIQLFLLKVIFFICLKFICSLRQKQTDRITLRWRSLAAVEGIISENLLSLLINHVLPQPML